MARIRKSVFLTLLVFLLFGVLQFNMVSPALAAAGDPTVTLDDIAAYITTPPTISGTASDDSAVSMVEVLIKNNTNQTCWDGSVWQPHSWNIEVVDSGIFVGDGTSLALDPNGKTAISYYGTSGLKFAKWNGSSWDIEAVDSASAAGSDTSLAFDNNGKPAISYFDQSNGDLKFARWNGSGWDIEVVESEGIVGLSTSLAFDSSSNPAIAYRNHTDDKMKCAYWNGSSWDISEVASMAWGYSLAFDSSDSILISYYDFPNRNLNLARWNGSSWDIEVVDSAGHVGEDSSLTLDNNGKAAISYYDQSNGDLKFARWNGSSWDTEVVDSEGDVGQNSSLAFDSRGNPAISYQKFVIDDLKLAWWNGNSWAIDILDTEEHVGENSSIAFNNIDNPVISYYSFPTVGLKYAQVLEFEWPDATGTTSWSYTVPTLTDGSYTILARSTDDADNKSTIAFDSFVYDTTDPTTPASLAKTTLDTDNTPAFSWSAATDATSGVASYEVKLDSGSWSDVGNVTTYTFSSTVADGNHTLSLRAKDNAVNYSSEASLAFTIDTTSPSVPTSLAKTTPDADNTPAFTWSAATDATSGVASYEVKLDSGSWSDVGNVTTYTFSSTVADGNHILYLRAKDSADNYSGEASLAFTIDTPPPTIPASLVKTTADSDNTPTFTWNASTAASGIASYEVKLDDGTWTNIGNVTTYTFGSAVADGSHSLHIRAKDNAGHIGEAASAAFNIDVPDVPNQPTNTSPSNEAVGVSVTPTLESSAFSDDDTADTHSTSQWQISAASGQYSSATWDSGTDATNLTSISVPSDNLAASTAYYWRVRHQDNHGNWSEWSAETSFTTAGGGGGCGASAAAASTADVASSFGLLGFLSVSGVFAHKKRKRR